MAEVIVLEDVAADCDGGNSLRLAEGTKEAGGGRRQPMGRRQSCCREIPPLTAANKVPSNVLGCEQQLGSAVTLWDV